MRPILVWMLSASTWKRTRNWLSTPSEVCTLHIENQNSSVSSRAVIDDRVTTPASTHTP